VGPRTHRLVAPLALVAALLAPRAEAAPVPVTCDHLVVSPTVARDRTVFCVHTTKPIAIATSTDLGRTWRRVEPRGFVGSDQQDFNGLIPSPTYARDGLLYLQTADALYASVDGGATLTLADAAGGASTALPSITALRRVEPDTPVPGGVLLAQSFQVAPPDLLLPPMRTKAVGAPGLVETILAAPPGDGRYAGAVLAFGRDAATLLAGGLKVLVQDVVYACTPELVCPTARGRFPSGEYVEDIYLSPDYARTGVIHAVTRRGEGRRGLWISRDGGATFEPFRSAQRLVDAVAKAGKQPLVRVVSDPRNPRRMYLRIWGRDTPSVPAEQMFRSDDAGQSWRRIGFRRANGSGPAKEWPYGSGYARGDDESMVALPDGRLLAIGMAGGVHRLYCSTDDATTWQATCRR
jgi:hypothetical protein